MVRRHYLNPQLKTLELQITANPELEGGYATTVLGLPGCFSQGNTIQEAMANTKEAINSYLLALHKKNIEDRRPK